VALPIRPFGFRNRAGLAVTAELPGTRGEEYRGEAGQWRPDGQGEKQEEKTEKKKDYRLHERRFGSFSRYFSMPESVDADKIEASFKDGVPLYKRER
jgi:HSP20 family protein